MRYTLKTELHQDVSIYAVNKVAPRAYFIPFADREKLDSTSYLNERYNSDRVQILNGEWDFIYYPNCNDAPLAFDSDSLVYNTVNVPSTWQRTGYEIPWYLNTRYQFAMKPPVVPSNMPMSIYRKTFVANDIRRKYTLTFLGAAASLAVYLNGDFVGYSEGSHNMAQFDVSKHMRNGVNELMVVVQKWCNGSYMECQDMFRENGIFRDVYITESEICDLVDFDVLTIKKDINYTMQVKVFVENLVSGSAIHVEVYDKNGKLFLDEEKAANESTVFEFDNLNVNEWTAETPNLYTLYISLHTPNNDSTIIRHFVGFKNVAIKGEVFIINGQNVKLKGVNHHDTDPENGWVMTAEQLLRDVKIMKEYNCNAVRMSHYPPDPILLTMCDIYGLYAIDEADIECHGVYSNVFNQRYGRISNNLIWREHFIDRVANMYYRDRNHPSIIMWSLGNEAGGYKCHDAAAEFLRSVTTTPIHYENVIHTKRHSYDVVSEMYTHTSKLQKIGEHTIDERWLNKPFFICEYAHAMGLGPGALEVYMDMFLKYDNLMGGCIWEFCDHAVFNKNSKWKYTYGGDHGEPKHDGNFCVDGLFFPDRTPSTGALCMKNVYRPIRAKLINNDTILFTNTNRFLNTKYITAVIETCVNGVALSKIEVEMDIQPKQTAEVKVDVPKDKTKDIYFIINYFDGDLNIAFEQLIVKENQYITPQPMGSLETAKNGNIITIKFKGGSIVYDNNSGELVSYSVNGAEMINHAPRLGLKGILPNFWRGLIDNDRFIQIAWNLLGYNKVKPKYLGGKVDIQNNLVNITAKYKLVRMGTVAKVTIKYTILPGGIIEISATMKKGLKLAFYSDIPRFGVTMEMPKEYNNIEYYGMGERENLSDFKEHTKLGVYNIKVADMHEQYIKPQESGNRTNVRYAKITNDKGQGLMFVHSGAYLNFNANHFTLKELVRSNHTEDLVNVDTTNVQIDGFMRGAGSQSCGQGPLEVHKPSLKTPLTYSFRIIPINE